MSLLKVLRTQYECMVGERYVPDIPTKSKGIMRKIGLLGGMSPHSTMEYYRDINKFVNDALGDHHSAKIFLASLDFDEIVTAIYSNQWNKVAAIIKEFAFRLQDCDVDMLSICSNTLHKVYPELVASTNIKILHILDPVIDLIKRKNMQKIALLGTKFTMEDGFYASYMRNKCSAELVIPCLFDREIINDIIFNDLCKGQCAQKSIDSVNRILENLSIEQVDAVILGCTELPILFNKIESQIPTINTVALHSRALASFVCQTEVSVQ